MIRAAAVVALGVAFCLPGIARSQVSPAADFSGVWVLDTSKNKNADVPVRVGNSGPGGNIQPPSTSKYVAPVYPPDAIHQRIAGAVIIAATIDKAGSVAEESVVVSIPALDQAALDAVRQWEYTPTLLNGQPVPIIMTVTVNFKVAGVVPTPGVATPPHVSVGPPRVTITQDAMSLTMTRDTPAGLQVTVYRLDGSESKNSVSDIARGAAEYRCRSHREGAKLITVITATSAGKPSAEFTETRYLDGDTMVVEVASPSPAGAEPVVQKQVFKRAAPR